MSRKLALSVLLCTVLLPASLSAQSLFVGSGDGLSPLIYAFRGDPFTGPTPITGAGSVLAAFPAGTRYYVFSRSAAGTVSVVDANTFALIRTFNLGTTPIAVTQTPDGRRILVLTSTGGVRIFDAVLDTELAPVYQDLGASPSDIAVSYDSQRAFVLSPPSQRVTVIDVNSGAVVGAPVLVSGYPQAIATGPNGLVYVSGQNTVWEYFYNPLTSTLALRSQITFSGVAGKLAFSPDATKAAAINLNPGPAYPASVFLFDITNHIYLGSAPQMLAPATKVVVPDANRCFMYVSGLQKMYQVSFSNPSAPVEPSFGGVTLSTVRDVVGSIEAPTNRYLYVGSDVYLYKIDLTTNAVASQIGISGNRVGDIALALPTASTGMAASVIAFNANQTVGLGSSGTPLVVKVVDYNGKPVANATVTFTATLGGVIPQTPTVTTALDGTAGTIVSVPAIAGVYQVTATVSGTGAMATFTLNVSSTGGTGGTGYYGLQIWAGHGQVIGPNTSTSMTGQEQLKVRYVDGAGNPIPGVSVSWAITDQQYTSGTVSPAVSITDANGFAVADYIAAPVVGGPQLGNPVGRTTITATAAGQVVVFNIITLGNPVLGGNSPGFITPRVNPPDGHVTVKAGTTAVGAITVQVFANGAFPLSGVSVRLQRDTDSIPTSPSVCAGGIVLTDAAGMATCDVVGAGGQGSNAYTLVIGGTIRMPFRVDITPGDPADVRDVEGNNQRGRAGQKLPQVLAATVVDAYGNLTPGGQVVWEVAVPGSATLSNVVSVADTNGRVSAAVTLGSTPGPIQINLRTGAKTFTFTVYADVSIGQTSAVSGDGQTAVINQAFAQPLVVRVVDPQGTPVTNYDVRFEVVSGSATLASPTAKTDSSGRASMNVTAGSAPGPVVIRALVDTQAAVVFNLTVRLPGPVLDVRQMVNAAGYTQGITPGALVTIYGAGIAPGLKGAVTANTFGFGPLPTKLADVEVIFGNLQAPILSVANIDGQESVTVQAPFELAAPSVTTVTVKVGGGSTTLNNVPVQAVNPGIFETVDPATGRRFAIIIKEDGSLVTPSNPARKNEKLRMFLTGIGPATPAAFTNRLGVPGQAPVYRVIVGVNDEGLDEPYTVALSQTLIGVWEVTFRLNATTPVAPQVKLSVGVVGPDGNQYYSNNTNIALVN